MLLIQDVGGRWGGEVLQSLNPDSGIQEGQVTGLTKESFRSYITVALPPRHPPVVPVLLMYVRKWDDGWTLTLYGFPRKQRQHTDFADHADSQ